MKNIVKMFVTVLIVSISGIKTVQAQGYEGHGLSTVDIQRITDEQEIEANGYKAVFGTLAEAKGIYRTDLKNYTQQQLIDLTGRDIFYQMGEEFDARRPQDYRISYIVMNTNSKEWFDFCAKNEDGYVVDKPGESNFHFGNPANAWASKHKATRIVMVITKISSNRSARIFADCINGIHGIVEQRFGEAATGTGYGPAKATADVSVVIRQENPYAAIDQRVGARNGKFPVVAKVAIVVVAAAILVKYVLMPALAPKTVDTNHSNAWPDQQGGSGGTTTTGGSGGQQTH
jgi:hypothetical protein